MRRLERSINLPPLRLIAALERALLLYLYTRSCQCNSIGIALRYRVEPEPIAKRVVEEGLKAELCGTEALSL